MKKFLLRFAILPLVFTALFYLSWHNDVPQFQSPRELPEHLTTALSYWVMYCGILGFLCSFFLRILGASPTFRSGFYWTVATVPVAVGCVYPLVQEYRQSKNPVHSITSYSTGTRALDDLSQCLLVGRTRAPASVDDGIGYIYFSNHSKAPVTVNWMNSQGELKKYKVLLPGQGYEQNTQLGHFWVVTDQKEKCVGAYPVESEIKQVLFR